MRPVQKTLLVVAAILVAVAIAWPLLVKFPFGRLPGDIVIRRDGVTFHLPLTTMVLVSIVITVILRVFGK